MWPTPVYLRGPIDASLTRISQRDVTASRDRYHVRLERGGGAVESVDATIKLEYRDGWTNDTDLLRIGPPLR